MSADHFLKFENPTIPYSSRPTYLLRRPIPFHTLAKSKCDHTLSSYDKQTVQYLPHIDYKRSHQSLKTGR